MIYLIFALALIAILQGVNWAANQRIQAEYSVLKKKLEDMDSMIRLLQDPKGKPRGN